MKYKSPSNIARERMFEPLRLLAITLSEMKLHEDVWRAFDKLYELHQNEAVKDAYEQYLTVLALARK